MTDFFKGIGKIAYEGLIRQNEFASATKTRPRWGRPHHGRTSAFAIAYCTPSPGRGDPFGGQTFERPWFGDSMIMQS